MGYKETKAQWEKEWNGGKSHSPVTQANSGARQPTSAYAPSSTFSTATNDIRNSLGRAGTLNWAFQMAKSRYGGNQMDKANFQDAAGILYENYRNAYSDYFSKNNIVDDYGDPYDWQSEFDAMFNSPEFLNGLVDEYNADIANLNDQFRIKAYSDTMSKIAEGNNLIGDYRPEAYNGGSSFLNYAAVESKHAKEDAAKIDEQLKAAQDAYAKARLSNDTKTEEAAKQKIAELESQKKQMLAYADASQGFVDQYMSELDATNAKTKAAGKYGSMEQWYGATEIQLNTVNKQIEDLEKQIRQAESGNKALEAGAAYNVQTEAPEDVAALKSQLEEKIKERDAIAKEHGYAGTFRYDDTEITEESIALGKATYEAQHEEWISQYDEAQKATRLLGDTNPYSSSILSFQYDKSYQEPTDKWTEQELNLYYTLLGDGSDPAKANEYAEKTNRMHQQMENQAKTEEIAGYATDNFGTGLLHSIGAVGAGLMSGAEFVQDAMEYAYRGTITEKGFGLSDYSQAVTSSIGSYLNQQYGTLGEEAGGVFAGKGVGDLYQTAISVGQSWAALAMTGGSSALVTAMFFGQAAKSKLDEELARGADPGKAVLMGVFSGAAEAIGEVFSIENIKALKAVQMESLLFEVMRSAGIEASEEGMTTLLNTFADKIINGSESEYNVALESYISQGMSYDEAQRKATKDWINGIAADMVAGGISGGISAGAINPVVRGVKARITPFTYDQMGVVDGAAEYEGSAALAEKYRPVAEKGNMTVAQSDKLTKAITEQQESQNKNNVLTAIENKLKETGGTVDNVRRVADVVYKSASGMGLTADESRVLKENPAAHDVRKELAGYMENGEVSVSKLNADTTPDWLKGIDIQSGKRMAPTVKIGKTSGKLSGLVTEGGKAQIMVNTDSGETMTMSLEEAIDKGALPESVENLAHLSAGLGDIGGDVFNLFDPDADISSSEYVTAMDRAINMVASHASTKAGFLNSASAKKLNNAQREFAWKVGRERAAEIDKRAPKSRRYKHSGTVTYGGVTVDGKKYKGTTQDKINAGDLKVIKALAKAARVNVVFYESDVEGGRYVGANGFYREGVVYLDIHAAAKNTNQKDAILLTAAHELTHHIRANAPERYKELKQFVIDHMLEKGVDFENLVSAKMRQKISNDTLDYDAAVEEVIADSCEQVLKNSKFVETMAKESPKLFDTIKEWLDGFAENIRSAFEGIDDEQFSKESKAMMDELDELTKLWDKAMVEAAKSEEQAEGDVEAGLSGVKHSLRDSHIPTYAELINKKPLKVIDLRGTSTERYSEQRKVLKENTELYKKPVVNKDTGEAIFVVPKTLSHAFSNKENPQENINAIKRIKSLIEEAVLTHAEPSEKSMDHTTGVYTLFAAGFTKNGLVPVRLKIKEFAIEGQDIPATIKEYFEANGYDDEYASVYDGKVLVLEGIEKEASSSALATGKNYAVDKYPSAPSKIRITDFLPLVNSEYQKYLPKSENIFSPRTTTNLTKEEAQEQAKSYTRLKAENAALKRRVDYWRTQTKRSKPTILERDINRFTNYLLKNYTSQADKAEIKAMLTAMGNYLVQGNSDTLDYDELYRMAMDIASEVVNNAYAALDNPYGDMEDDYASRLKSTTIKLDKQYEKDIPEGFRKQYKGIIKVSFEEGTSVDSFYGWLAEEYGEGLFPAYVDNPANQLAWIADMYDRTRSDYGNPFEGDINEVTLSLTHDIIDTMLGEDIRQTPKTFADKAQAKLDKQRAVDKDAYNKLRAEKNERIAEIRRNAQARKTEAVAKERAKKWETVAAVREYYQNQAKEAHARRKESAAVKKYRDRVYDTTDTLMRWLRVNSDKEHVPEALKAPLIELLDSLDFRSKSALKGGDLTKLDQKYLNAMQDLKDILTQQRNYMADPGNYEGLDVFIDLPSGFTDEITNHLESVKGILQGADAWTAGPINAMNADQLRDLAFILNVLKNSIKQINQFITDSHYAGVIDAAKDTRDYLGTLGEDLERSIGREAAAKFMQWQNALPYYVFKRFGAAGMERFKAISNGWGQMAQNAYQIIEYTKKVYDRKEVKQWEEEVQSIELSDGTMIRMTTAQMMGLWCTARREQGLKHLLVGGMRIGTIERKGGKTTIDQRKAVHLTEADLAKIGGMLTVKQVEVATKLQEFMNTVCSDWGNQISMARFGYRQFTEQFYYPITTDNLDRDLADTAAKETELYRLPNMSATKALNPNANNSVIINSIFDVFAAHTADMAKYNALVLPILDLLKWYNVRERIFTDSADGTTRHLTVNSVRKSIDRTYGKKATEYILHLVKDLNGVREAGRNEGLLKGMVGRYKAAAVAFNLRVAMQQPTSIVRAAYAIDSRYLTRAATMSGGAKEAMEYSGLARWKSLGFFDTNIARGMTEQIKNAQSVLDTITDKGMILAEKADQATWGVIWNAAKLEVRERNPGLTGDALMKAVQERFDDIILATQVMDSTISRSDMMRSQTIAVAEVTSFMSEPTVTYNMLLDSGMEFVTAKRMTGSIVEARKRAWKTMGKAAGVYAVSAVTTAAFAAIVDALRDDDEYQTLVQKWVEAFFNNSKQNISPLNLLPLIGDLVAAFTKGETPDSMMWQPMTQLRNAVISAVDIVKPWFDPDAELSDPNRTNWGRVYRIAQGLSSLSGVGLASFMRDFKALWNISGGLITGKKMKFYDSGAKGSIKAAVIDGYLSEEDAVALLMEVGETTDVDDAYWMVQGWVHDDEDGWSRYNDVYSAIMANDKEAYEAAKDGLGDHGIPANTVRSEAKSQIHRWFVGADGEGQKMDKETALVALKTFAGLHDAEARHTLDEWQMELTHGIRYADLQEEFVAGNVTEHNAVYWQTKYGHVSEAEAKEKVRQWRCEKETGIKYGYLSDWYIHDDVSGQDALSYLMEYGGLTRMEAESKIASWDVAKDLGIELYSTEYGLKAQYLDEYITKDTVIATMISRDGKTPEEAEDYFNQYDFTKQTGYNWSDGDGVREAMAAGVISEEEAVQWYMKASVNTHGSEEIAREYVEVDKWKLNTPDADKMNRDGLKKWNDKGKYMTQAGLGQADFAKVWTLYQEAEPQYNETGEKTAEKAEVFFDKLYGLYQSGQYTMDQVKAISKTMYSNSYIRKYRHW